MPDLHESFRGSEVFNDSWNQGRLAICLNTKETVLSFRQLAAIFFVSVACDV